MTKKLFMILFLVALATAVMAAQDVGRLTGTVTENYCRPFPKDGGLGERGAVAVPLYLVQDESAYYTETRGDGSYVFDEVPAGAYQLYAFAFTSGRFYVVNRLAIRIQTGETSTANFHIPFSVPGHLIVDFVDSATRAEIDALNKIYGIIDTRVIVPSRNIYLLVLPEGSYVQDFLEAYQQEKLVQWAEPNSYLCLLN